MFSDDKKTRMLSNDGPQWLAFVRSKRGCFINLDGDIRRKDAAPVNASCARHQAKPEFAIEKDRCRAS